MIEQQTEKDLSHQFIAKYLEQHNAPKRYGGRYPDYLRFITARVDYIGLPVSKQREYPLALQDIEREAKGLGFTPQEIGGMSERTDILYQAWLVRKHAIQAQELFGKVTVRRGTDPHISLGDGSHPHGLGYIQSQRE